MTRGLRCALLAAWAAAACLGATAAAAETFAIVHAKALLPASGAPVEDTTVVVQDGRIVAAGRRLAAPAGARVIDAQGRLVTAGLMNAGSQLGLVEVNSLSDTGDASVSGGPLGPSFDVQFALNPNSVLIPVARADGLTRAGTYPDGSGSPPFAGQAASLRLGEGADILDRPKAMMFAQVGGMSDTKAGGSRSAQWQLLRNALDEARQYGRTPRPAGPRDQLLNHLDAEALQPVLAGRMALALFASRESDLRQAIRLADDYKVRVVVFGGQEAWRVARELAAHAIPVVLDPVLDLPWTFDEIGARADNAALLDRAGVQIAFMTQGVPYSLNAGEALREGAGLAVASGLPWASALKALTVNAAKIWGVDDHYGLLAPGQDADLVIWDGDPLEPSSAPVLVMVRGQPASLTTRQSLLAARYAPAASGAAVSRDH